MRRMEMSTNPSGPPDRLPDALDYSWKWFSYHADQRLKAFNYYLVIVGVLVVGYLKCLELGLRWPAAVIAGFGAIVSLAFWILDIRNTELVNYGRAALEELEPKFNVAIRTEDKNRTMLRASMGRVPRFFFCLLQKRDVREESLTDTLTKHQTWLRAILVIGLVAFVIALVMTLAGIGIGTVMPGAYPPPTGGPAKR
jgi:hypothetical protein